MALQTSEGLHGSYPDNRTKVRYGRKSSYDRG
jgi:hypothetical protein